MRLFVDGVQKGVDVFVFGFLVESAVEEATGFGFVVTKNAEHFESLAKQVAFDVGNRSCVTGDEERPDDTPGAAKV